MRARLGIAALVTFAAAALLARGVRLDGDVSRLLPDTSPELRQAAELLRRVAVVDVEGTAADAGRFVERLPESCEVRSSPPQDELLELIDTLRDRAPLLIEDYGALEERLRDVPAKLRTLARRLQEPDGAHLARLAAIDPLGVTNLALKPLESLVGGLKDAHFDESGIVSGDGEHRLILLDPGFPAADTERTAEFLEALDRAGEGLKVRHLGTHRSTFENARRIEADAVRSGVIGSILVLVIVLLIFRRIAPALLAITPALFGAVVAIGIFAVFRDTVTAAVAGFSAALLGITIDYAIHIFYGSRVPYRAILVGATTTAAAFLCLNASALPGLRESGTLGAIGVLAAALFALAVLRPRKRLTRADLGPVTRVLQGRAVLGLALLPLVFLLLGIPRVRTEGDVMKMSRISDEAQRDEEEIRRVWGDAFRTTVVLVEGATLDEALERNDAVAVRFGETPHASISGLLPAPATQARRLARWREFWDAERIAALRSEIERGVVRTPFRADAFEPFFGWVSADPGVLGVADLPESLLRDRLQRTDRGWLVATPVFDPDFEEVEGGLVVNRTAMVRRISTAVTDELRTLGLLAFVAVGAVVGLWFGRWRPVLVVLAALAASCLATIGLLGWLGIAISLANAAFVVFLFGLAVDYAVFLVEARISFARTGVDRVAESDGAVLVCAITTCAGFGALALASHPVLRSIGLTAVLGIATAALLMQLIVPRLWRPAREPRSVADLYRDQGPLISRYAAGKARRDPIVEEVASLGPRREILVAGCGYGIVAARLLLSNPRQRLRGIDRDARKLEVARRTLRDYPNAEFLRADLLVSELGCPDTVTLIDVLHYWSEGRQALLVKRLADALEAGGELWFRDGCADRPGHDRVHRSESFALRVGFTRRGEGLHFRTEAGWRTLLEDCGLEILTRPGESGSDSNLFVRCRKPTP